MCNNGADEMRIALPILCSLLISSNIVNAKPINVTPPEGWSVATYEDAIDDWAEYDSPNKVVADFNGDGKDDVAQILLSNKGMGYRVIAEVTTGNTITQYTLDDSQDTRPQTQSIDLAEPSNEVWESACQKGYWDCEDGEIRQFKITKPSIMHCYIEKACVLYMWSDRNNNFTKIRFSD